MLLDKIPQQCPQRLALLVFRQDPGNVTRNRIGSSGPDFPVDSRQLILGQADSDLRPGHTRIIPLVNGRYKLNATTDCVRPACSERFDPRSGKRGSVAAGPLMSAHESGVTRKLGPRP